MLFRQLFDRTSCTYTYLLASGPGREAILIDPVIEHTERYLKLIEELDLRLVVAVDTHIHADHITAIGRLQQMTDCRSMLGEMAQADCVSHHIKDGEELNVDGVKLRALYTPGHTDDSYSYVMDDRVFSGDTLMIRGTGRTDFQNGDALAQYDSLFNKLLKLHEETLVYPAHDYNGMLVSTVGEEKRFNPRLQVEGPQAYAELMGSLNLPSPKMMDIAVPANLKCGLIDATAPKKGSGSQE